MKRFAIATSVAALLVCVSASHAGAQGMSVRLAKVTNLDRGKGIMRVIEKWERRGYMPWGLAKKGKSWHILLLKGFKAMKYSESWITTIHTDKASAVTKKLRSLVDGGYLPVGMAKLRKNRLMVLAIKLKGDSRKAIKSLKIASCQSTQINACLKKKLSLLNQNYLPTAVAEFGNQVVLMFVKSKVWVKNITGWGLKVRKPSQLLRVMATQLRSGRMPVGIMFYTKTSAVVFYVRLKS